MSETAVIIVAGGSGSRLGVRTSKAFVDIAGRPMLAHALDSIFGMHRDVQVIVVVPGERLDEGRAIAGSEASVVAAGATRQASVAAGLAALCQGIRTVLVHDAARPLTPPGLFDSIADEVERTGHGIVPGLPVIDTIKQTDASGRISQTVDRAQLRAVQTPQGFPRHILVAAYSAMTGDHTDDAAIVSAAGEAVSVITGDPIAFKITTGADLQRAEDLIAFSAESYSAPVRTGTGADAHALDPSVPLWLAGLYWPNEPGLAGHSDGDVACHAIADALLSAAGLGDLGSVFGTADPRFAGAHGELFLTATRTMVEVAGYRIANASVQVIGARPSISPRRREAQERLSGILGAPVSVSSTTTDGLGLTGRGEGIAAIASVLLQASK